MVEAVSALKAELGLAADLNATQVVSGALSALGIELPPRLVWLWSHAWQIFHHVGREFTLFKGIKAQWVAWMEESLVSCAVLVRDAMRWVKLVTAI
jgi:hypothetical protein